MTDMPPIAIIGDGGLRCVARAKKGRPLVARKTGWEDTTKQPDWIDIESMMRAMTVLHGGLVGLTVLPRGIGSSGGLSVGVSILIPAVMPAEDQMPLTVTKDWPCSQHKDLVSHCFALLYDLDFKVQQMYKQRGLFE